MIDPGATVRREAAAIVRIAAAFSSLGIAIDAGAAVRSGVSISEFALLVVADVVAALEGDQIGPEVVAVLERARAG